ncbi:hypothetical protein ONZ45_g9527 [Pleurotus djamor]|nr:hypothetical protein ONZ45_g9527 [Pleurotus djamor]
MTSPLILPDLVRGTLSLLDTLRTFKEAPASPGPPFSSHPTFPHPSQPISAFAAAVDQAVSMVMHNAVLLDAAALAPPVALIMAILVLSAKPEIDFTSRDIQDIILVTHITSRLSTLTCIPHTIFPQLTPRFHAQLFEYIQDFIPDHYWPSETPWDASTIMAAWEPLWRLSANTITYASRNPTTQSALEALCLNFTEKQYKTPVNGMSVSDILISANPILREGLAPATPGSTPITSLDHSSSRSIVRRFIVAIRGLFCVKQSIAQNDVEAGRPGLPAQITNGIPDWMPVVAAMIAATILHASKTSRSG